MTGEDTDVKATQYTPCPRTIPRSPDCFSRKSLKAARTGDVALYSIHVCALRDRSLGLCNRTIALHVDRGSSKGVIDSGILPNHSVRCCGVSTWYRYREWSSFGRVL